MQAHGNLVPVQPGAVRRLQRRVDIASQPGLLEKYPRLRFVENPHFLEMNNISSVDAARDLLAVVHREGQKLLVAGDDLRLGRIVGKGIGSSSGSLEAGECVGIGAG